MAQNLNCRSTAVTGNTNVNTTLSAAQVDSNWNQLATSAGVQFNNLGVGTANSGTAGEIRATGNVTAYYSDIRLKTKLGTIENAIEKVKSLEGFYYEANEVAQELGYTPKREVGVSAQDVQSVLPEIVSPAPIDDKYLTIDYARLAPLLIEAIKEQQKIIEAQVRRIDLLEASLNKLK